MHPLTENLRPSKYASTKSKPLEAKDIEYDPTVTLIADLKDHNAEQRKEYYKAIQAELEALTALGFAQIIIIPENHDGISTRFVLKVKSGWNLLEAQSPVCSTWIHAADWPRLLLLILSDGHSQQLSISSRNCLQI